MRQRLTRLVDRLLRRLEHLPQPEGRCPYCDFPRRHANYTFLGHTLGFCLRGATITNRCLREALDRNLGDLWRLQAQNAHLKLSVQDLEERLREAEGKTS